MKNIIKKIFLLSFLMTIITSCSSLKFEDLDSFLGNKTPKSNIETSISEQRETDVLNANDEQDKGTQIISEQRETDVLNANDEQDKGTQIIPKINTFYSKEEITNYLIDVTRKNIALGNLYEAYAILTSLKEKVVGTELTTKVQNELDSFLTRFDGNNGLEQKILDSNFYGFKYWNGKYGFLNALGEIVIDPIYDRISNFSDGRALVILDNNTIFIDYDGTPVIREENGIIFANSFSEGLALVVLGSNYDGDYGYIDTKGNLAIEPQEGIRYISDFSEGLAIASVYNNGSDLRGFIDQQGNWVIEPQFEDAHIFSEGYAAVQYEFGGNWGYIDAVGNSYKPVFSDDTFVGDFHNGLALGLIRKLNMFAFINKKFEVVIPLEGYNYRSIGNYAEFSEGFATIGKITYTSPASEFYVFNTEGEIVHSIINSEQIDELQGSDEGISFNSPFSFGACIFRVQWEGDGIFDYFGNIQVEPSVRGISDEWFYLESLAPNGLYYVSFSLGEDDFGYIDQYGNIIYQP